jgi:membrane-associated sensor protein
MTGRRRWPAIRVCGSLPKFESCRVRYNSNALAIYTEDIPSSLDGGYTLHADRRTTRFGGQHGRVPGRGAARNLACTPTGDFATASCSPRGAVLQFVACLVISSFPASVPKIDSFIPTILAIVFVADLVTAVLLFNQSSLVASRALLILANGYLFSALIAIPQALTFPGAFAPGGLFGAGAQSSAWLNVFWNLGFIVAVAGYAWLKGEEHRSDAVPPSTLSAFCWSTVIQIGLICVLTWAVTTGDRFMPRMFLDDLNSTPLVRYAAGTIVLLSVLTLLLMWARLTSVIDLWVMAAISMLITEKTLVTFGMTTRFSLGWYASRALVVAVSLAVLLALLAELMRLHVRLIRSQERRRALNALDHQVQNVLATIRVLGKDS